MRDSLNHFTLIGGVMANFTNERGFSLKITPKVYLVCSFTLLLLGAIDLPQTLAATRSGGRYKVEVETSPGNDHFTRLGAVYSFVTDDSLEGFYDYRNYKYNGIPLNFQPDQAHIFLVHSRTTNELGLFSINGSPLETSTAYIQLEYKINNGLFTRLAVTDEPDEIPLPQGPIPAPFERIESLYGWCNQFNDGAVLSYVGNTPESRFSLEVKVVSLWSHFNGQMVSDCSAPVKTIDSMVFLSAKDDGEVGIGPDFMFQQNLQDGLTFRITPANVPEPSFFNGLLMMGFLGLGLMSLKRNK